LKEKATRPKAGVIHMTKEEGRHEEDPKAWKKKGKRKPEKHVKKRSSARLRMFTRGRENGRRFEKKEREGHKDALRHWGRIGTMRVPTLISEDLAGVTQAETEKKTKVVPDRIR